MGSHDVVIVGASIAGCTAATLYGRAGLRVALIEKHHSADAFKALCGHFVLAGTEPMLRRTGLWESMVEAGGVPAGISRWSPAGWITPPDGVPSAISLRRERLDPLLRGIAGQTPGVDLILGQRVTGLLTEGGRVVGVRTRDGAGAEYEHRARLVVGADGYHSTVAGLAGAREDRSPNNRFGMWAYYRGVTARAPGPNHVWNQGRDTAIAIRTDDDLTMLVAFPVKERLAEFQADRADALERFIRRLPDAPDLSVASRVSKLIGMTDYPCVRRDPTPAPGLFLAGDAALAGDPQPAVGCGWAFRGAEWLAESTIPMLRGQSGERAARAGYRRRLRFIERHDRVSRRAALAGPPNLMERAMLTAAAVDPVIGRRAYLFAMRAIGVSGLINPAMVGRSLLTSRRSVAASRRSQAASERSHPGAGG